jgi:anti-anti-sigma regulatory factor
LNITVENARDEVMADSFILCAAVPHHRRDIIVDLSGVTAIDAAGICALVSLQAVGTCLRLVGTSGAARRVLRLTNPDSVFDMSESECSKETLVRALRDEWDFTIPPESA